MSMNRGCGKCGIVENIRFNFGSNVDAEIKFHDEDWHNCDKCTCAETVDPPMCVCSLKKILDDENKG